ncbi:hypothetical protein PHET_01439 [Paragonimus heterotremus]|uniref:Uncharacterized protein n=1 Tax=Paragonimus heterotremus TaxID=100268 RepID=A0A8J4STK6_9TREM|nr:hypothetical protein PHET_01439 [Paragonimus heterotremus]
MAGATTGETEFAVCEDLEKPSRLMKLRQEMEQKQTVEQDMYSREDRPSELVRRRSSANTRRASIRRTSMREKKLISWKEAKQEAEMLGLSPVTLRLDAEVGTSDAEVLTALNETTAQETHVASPVKMSTVKSSDPPAAISQTGRTSPGNLSRQKAITGLSSSVTGSNNSIKLTSPFPANSFITDQTSISSGATSPQTASSPSKLQGSTSTTPPCTKKAVSDDEKLASTSREIVDPEHKFSHRPKDTVCSQSEKSPSNPNSQVCLNRIPTDAVEVHTPTNLCPIPGSHVHAAEHTNNRVRDSDVTSSLPLTNAHSEPLIDCSLPQSYSTSCRQSIGSSSSSANESDRSSPELSTYSKYFPPRPTQVNDSRTKSTKNDSSLSPAIRTKQKSTHSFIHSTDSLRMKTNVDLIECSSHRRPSGKCCTLI